MNYWDSNFDYSVKPITAEYLGNTFVFGGPNKTAEYLVLGEDSWKKLPPMHYERAGATACVLP